jgi:hypothetical protein
MKPLRNKTKTIHHAAKLSWSILFCLILVSCTKHNKQQEATTLNAETLENKSKEEQYSTTSNNQNEFKWSYTLCYYTGNYDANKFTNKQLENTLKYLVNSDGTSVSVIIFTASDLNDYKRENVKLEFDDRLRKLKTLEFVKTPFFEKIKEKRIQEVERTKLLTLMKLDAYTNAEVLRNDKYSNKQCAEYANALIAGGQTLLDLRKKMAEEASKAGNEIAMERYLEETKTNNELLLARIYVIAMGWWNCVNNSIDRVDEYDAHQNGFLKLFDSVSFECDEP